MDDNAVEVVSRALAGNRWSAHPFPVEYLPALAWDVLWALGQSRYAVVALPEGRRYPQPPSTVFSHGVSAEGCRVLDGNQPMSPLDAREYAAVLLAAANVAEVSNV